MIRDGVVHVWDAIHPGDVRPDEFMCTRERPFVAAPGVRLVFHTHYDLRTDGDHVCLACGTSRLAERSAEA